MVALIGATSLYIGTWTGVGNIKLAIDDDNPYGLATDMLALL